MESRSKSRAIVAEWLQKVCAGNARRKPHARGRHFVEKSDELENLIYAATGVVFLVLLRVF